MWLYHWVTGEEEPYTRVTCGIGWLGSAALQVKTRSDRSLLTLLTPYRPDVAYKEDWGVGCDSCGQRTPAYSLVGQVKLSIFVGVPAGSSMEVLTSWAVVGGVEPLTATLLADDAIQTVRSPRYDSVLPSLDQRSFVYSKTLENKALALGPE